MNQTEKHYHHGDLRNALIQAGLSVLSERGVDGLNLREVARRAGVSHAAPYRHFSDKEALLAAMAEDGFRGLGQQITLSLVKLEGKSAEKINTIGKNYIHFALENRDVFRLMFSHVIAHRERYPALYIAAKDIILLLKGLIEQGQTSGEFGSGDANGLTQSVWAMVHGLAALMVEDQFAIQSRDWQEATIAFHMQMVITSLQK